MRFSTILLPAFAAIAAAQQAATTDQVLTVRQAIKNVINATEILTTGLQNYNGDVLAVTTQSTAVITAINNGIAAVKPINATIDFAQASSYLIDVTIELNSAVATATNTVIAKKPTFVSACLGSSVLLLLGQQVTAATSFRSTIAAKFDAANQEVVQNLSQSSLDSLQNAVNAYNDTANGTCTPSTASTTTSHGAGPTLTSNLELAAAVGLIVAIAL